MFSIFFDDDNDGFNDNYDDNFGNFDDNYDKNDLKTYNYCEVWVKNCYLKNYYFLKNTHPKQIQN